MDPRGRGFDYQRKASGSTPVSKAKERLCNSSGAQSNPPLSAINKMPCLVRGFLLMMRRVGIWTPEEGGSTTSERRAGARR